jgi:4-amino-4-deoxy-L-arabinose transferase-like glycosyltransferase
VSRRALPAIVAAALAAGVVLRVWVLASPLGALDADEGVWGLMAKRFAEGHFATFYWGQSYGGTLETFLTAPVVAVGGANTVAVRAVPLALFAVATFLVWRVGRRTVGEPAALVAAAAYALWPAYLIWKSTRAHGFYGVATVLTLLVLLLALRLRERDSRLDLALLGLLLGVGWWTSPQVAFVALPAVAWLLWRHPVLIRRAWLVAPGLALGAAPWFVWNARHGWTSFTPPFGDNGSYFDHLRTFFYAALPQALGLRVPFTFEWIPGLVLGRLAELAAVAGVVWQAIRVRDDRLLLAVVALVYPLGEAISPFSSLNEEPRYLVLLAPVCALLLAQVLATPARAAAGIGVLAVLSAIGLVAMSHVDPPVPPVGRERTPADLGPLVRALDRAGVNRVCAHYAIAYRLDFETDERIVAASTGQIRWEPYQDAVARSPRVAWAFVRGRYEETARERQLRRAGYVRSVAGGWALWIPARTRSTAPSVPTAQSTNTGGRLAKMNRGCSHVTR